MNLIHLILFLIIGAVAGFLGSKIFKGKSNGLIINMIIGIIGSYLGGWLFGSILNLSFLGIFGPLILATAGSIILLWIISLIRK